MQFLNIYVDLTNGSFTVHRPLHAAQTIDLIHAPPIAPLHKNFQDATSPPPSRDSPTSSLFDEMSQSMDVLKRTTTGRVLVQNVGIGKHKAVIIQSNSLADLRARCKENFAGTTRCARYVHCTRSTCGYRK